MKRFLIMVSVVVGLATMPARAQTNVLTDTNTVSGTLWTALTTGSNYFAAVDGMYSVNNGQWGGGLALGYKVSDWFAPILRLDYFGSRFYMTSGNIELQVPQKLLGKIPVTPFITAGVGTPFSGANDLNGTPVGIAGVGAVIKFGWLGQNWFCQHAFIAGDYETWTGLADIGFKQQVRGAVGVKFGF